MEREHPQRRKIHKKRKAIFALLFSILVVGVGFATFSTLTAAPEVDITTSAAVVKQTGASQSRGIIFGLLADFGEDGGVSQLQSWQSGEVQPPIVAVSADSQYQPYTLYIHDQSVPFVNTGASGAGSGGATTGDAQAYIDAHPENAATYGGTKVFSGTDNYNTEFVGHDGGKFAILAQLHVGDLITVTDNTATPFTYKVNQVETVNADQLTLAEAQHILDFGNTERITLQTCVGNTKYRTIVYANVVN